MSQQQADWTYGSKKEFVFDLSKPKSYFECLYYAESLHNKGFEKIPHHEHDQFYCAMLHLDQARMQRAIDGRPALFCNAYFREVLRQAVGHAALVDADDEEEIAHADVEALEAVAAAPLLGAVVPREMEWRRCVASSSRTVCCITRPSRARRRRRRRGRCGTSSPFSRSPP